MRSKPRHLAQVVLFTGLALVFARCASSLEIPQGLTTTTPVIQIRDHATCDWPTRHAAVSKFNSTRKPELLLLADFILH